MRDLLEVCASEFERGIWRLFENVKTLPNSFLAETPVLGTRFFPDADYADLVPVVARALLARERFHMDNPAMPSLPLHQEEIAAAAEESECPRLGAVGLYARSLAAEEWDYDLHPRFAVFVGGLMADRHTTTDIRRDAGLQREYPAARLKGLVEGYWYSPKRLAWRRELEARGAVVDAWQLAERMERAQQLSV